MSKEAIKSIRAIQTLMLRDLEQTSDEELRAEIVEDGQDAEVLDRELAEGLDAVVAEFMRNRLAAAKAVQKATGMVPPKSRPSLEAIKRLIQRAFESDPNLAAAYRQGSEQSESDWISVFDDLVLLGKLDVNAHD
jgi:hypothetical protein